MTTDGNKMTESPFDLLIVGGGVNGTGIARDAAGRGLSVMLVEKDDLAAHTSSASTKLIHGGLRYLEHYEFGLVRKSLIEREVLLKNAPHIMWPLRFVMPHAPSMRPMWLMRLGVFLYDHLAKRNILPGSTAVSLREHASGAPLRAQFSKALIYSDGWVDDARLTVLNAVDAAARGALVLTRTRCERADAVNGGWTAQLRTTNGRLQTVRAKALVNAAGPWAAHVVNDIAIQAASKSLRLVRGSHIVVPQLFAHDHAYIFQNPDKRIVFAIPYEQRFTLIGTTDVEEHGDPGQATISPDEIDYLLATIARYFKKPATRSDVVWTYSGVRPLIDDASGDPSKVTRDYDLELSPSPAPLLNIWGGKITTFRKLAEESVDLLMPMFPKATGAWTASAPLPGGEIKDAYTDPSAAFEALVHSLTEESSQQGAALPAATLRRYARAYGTRARDILAAQRGNEIAPGVFEGELAYLKKHEWAQTGDDVLYRRSKLGLHLTPAQREAVSAWMQA
jgi:glycerol-3-phosphate dehydrogenase